MGRNSTQPKIKIKKKQFYKEQNYTLEFSDYIFFLLKAFPCTLVTATAQDVRKQRIGSLVLFANCKNSLNNSL